MIISRMKAGWLMIGGLYIFIHDHWDFTGIANCARWFIKPPVSPFHWLHDHRDLFRKNQQAVPHVR